MKIALIIMFCILNSAAYAEQIDSWFHPLPKNMDIGSEMKPISDDKFFEVAASKEATAEYWLAEKPFIAQTSESIKFFGQHNFQCPSPTIPYLFRAVYENGGTGSYYVMSNGSSVLISHQSLGRESKMLRSALIVCLGFEPTEVYHEIGGDI